MTTDLLPALRTFIRVVETGSFSGAGRLLGLSQPSVSRHVSILERHFGVRLFSRTTRSLAITTDGNTLLRYAQDLTNTLSGAENALARRRDAAEGMVRLGTPTAFGSFLARHLAGFLGGHPALVLDLVVRDVPGDMIEEGLDLAVWVGMPASTTMIVRHIGDVPMLLVAAPGYASARGLPREPADLSAHACLAYSYGGEARRWQFDRGGEACTVAIAGPLRANNSGTVHQASLSGLGIAMLPSFQVRSDIEAGRLLHVMPDWDAPSLAVHVAHPGSRTLPVRTRTILDFLVGLPIG